jgi:hypothetical protein
MTKIIRCECCRDLFYDGTNPHVIKEIAYDENCCPSCNAVAYATSPTCPYQP